MRRCRHTVPSFALLAALLAALLVAAAPPAIAGVRYAVVAVAGEGSVAFDINNAGDVVGTMPEGAAYHAFVSAGGAVTDIGAILGGSSSAMAINDHGVVVGNADGTGFVYSDGVAGTIPRAVTAQGINDAGTIVGQFMVGGTADGGAPHAYRYRAGTMTDLGSLPDGDRSRAFAVNAAGDVVGAAANMRHGAPHFPEDPFLYRDGVMTSLGNLGGVWSMATAINDRGQVVGYAGTDIAVDGPEAWPSAAFVADAAGLHVLGRLAPGWNSWANDINNRGQIVGGARLSVGLTHAFLVEDGVMIDLNTLVDPASGWVIVDASAINDRGQIAAQGCQGTVCKAVRLDRVALDPGGAPEGAGSDVAVAGPVVGTRPARGSLACLRC